MNRDQEIKRPAEGELVEGQQPGSVTRDRGRPDPGPESYQDDQGIWQRVESSGRGDREDRGDRRIQCYALVEPSKAFQDDLKRMKQARKVEEAAEEADREAAAIKAAALDQGLAAVENLQFQVQALQEEIAAMKKDRGR